jgi:hypothetical protein
MDFTELRMVLSVKRFYKCHSLSKYEMMQENISVRSYPDILNTWAENLSFIKYVSFSCTNFIWNSFYSEIMYTVTRDFLSRCAENACKFALIPSPQDIIRQHSLKVTHVEFQNLSIGLGPGTRSETSRQTDRQDLRIKRQFCSGRNA